MQISTPQRSFGALHPRTLRRKKKTNRSVGKKTNRSVVDRPPHGSKSAFVRDLPLLAARDIQLLAAKEGIKLSIPQIYNIRSVAKKRLETSSNRNRNRSSSYTSIEAKLRRIIAEVGLDRARKVFAEVESTFRF